MGKQVMNTDWFFSNLIFYTILLTKGGEKNTLSVYKKATVSQKKQEKLRKEMVFKYGIKIKQAAAYNGACMVFGRNDTNMEGMTIIRKE